MGKTNSAIKKIEELQLKVTMQEVAISGLRSDNDTLKSIIKHMETEHDLLREENERLKREKAEIWEELLDTIPD